MDKVLFISGSTEWETPPDLFKRYDDMYHQCIWGGKKQ
jgi:hypothetical protein